MLYCDEKSIVVQRVVGGTPAVEMPSPAIIQPTSLSLTSFQRKDQTNVNFPCGIEEKGPIEKSS